jgi:hypothetical protein
VYLWLTESNAFFWHLVKLIQHLFLPPCNGPSWIVYYVDCLSLISHWYMLFDSGRLCQELLTFSTLELWL